MLKVLTVVFALAACSYGRERLASATALIHRTTIPSPEFLHAMLDCWNRFSRPSSPHDCIPFPTALPRFVMNDMNHIKAIKGTVKEAAAVMNYSFNINFVQTTKEKLQYMYIRLVKGALSMEEVASVQKKCNIYYGVPITLTMQLDAAISSTFESTVFLTSNQMKEKVIVNFTGFTQAFHESVKDEIVKTRVTFSLTVSGSCRNLLKPADLGFTSSAKGQPWIVAFFKDFIAARPMSLNLSELIQHARSTHYSKRQAEDDDAANRENETNETNVAISEGPCRMYTQWVSFSELEWGENIISPSGFNINYCLGTCNFPQISSPKYNTTKHSHIQSIAAHFNPDYVPTPCCVPHEYSDLEILYEDLPGSFAMHTFTSGAVKSCGCK